MGFFGFGKKKEVLDLTEGYKLQAAALKQKKETVAVGSTQGNGPFSFFDSPAINSPESSDSDLSAEERKRKLARRLADMTEKTEDLGNQIYHLQQRLEVLERKLDIKRL